MTIDHPKLAELIGAEFRRVRKEEGFTLEDFASVMRAYGFKWSTSRVVELETGKVAPTLGVMGAICSALGEITGRSWRATSFLPGYGAVEIAAGVVVEISALRAALDAGDALVSADALDRKRDAIRKQSDDDEDAAWLRGPLWNRDDHQDAIFHYGLTDERAARALHLSVNQIVTAAVSLWSQTVEQERDNRAPAAANAQSLGRITRELLDELRGYVAERRAASRNA